MNNNRTALIKIKVKNILYWWMSLHRRVLLQSGGADLFQTQLSGFHLKVKRMLSSDLFPWSWVWKHCFVKEPDIQIWMMLFVGTKMMKSLSTVIICSCHTILCTYDGKGKEQVLDMGLQMSGVYQVWHHDIFLPEEEWVVPHYVLRDVASSARAFVMRNGGQFCTTKKKSWDWRSRRQGKSSSIFHQ